MNVGKEMQVINVIKAYAVADSTKQQLMKR